MRRVRDEKPFPPLPPPSPLLLPLALALRLAPMLPPALPPDLQQDYADYSYALYRPDDFGALADE